MKTLPRFLFLLAFSLSFTQLTFAQKLNLETQTKAAPGANHVGLSDGNSLFDWVPVANLNALLADEVQQGSGAPSGAPSGTQGWVYVNTANGAIYTWNGSAWALQGISSLTAVNGLTKAAQTLKLGGSLSENTTLNGASAYSLTVDSATTVTLRARTAAGTAHTLLQLSPFASAGANVSSINPSNTAILSNLNIRPTASTLSTRNTQTRGQILTDQKSAIMRYSTIAGEVETTRTQVRLDSTGTYLDSLKSASGGMTQVVYINPTTFEIGRGAAPSGAVVHANPATGVYVSYVGTGVTATIGSGTVTITVPGTAQLISARVTGADADNDGSGNRTIVFAGAGLQGNTSVATMNVPATQKIDLTNQAFGAPGTSNPFGVDDDDTVQVQVVGVGSVGSPSLSLRAVGLTANYNNYQLIFNW